MSFISKLKDESEVILTLEKYELSDLGTSHTIRQLIDNFGQIKNYYETQNFKYINTLDNYIDFLLVNFITLFNEESDYLEEPYKTKLKEVIAFAFRIIKQIEISSLIKYIKTNYKNIFEYNQNYFRGGVRKITLDLIVKYNNGVKNEGLFDYLIREEPILIFDNFDVMSKILKKDNGKLLNDLLLNENNFNELCKYRFRDICEMAERLYFDGYKEIAKELGNMIYKYIEKQFIYEKQNIINLQNIFHKANKTLYSLRSKFSKKVESYLREIDLKVEEYLLENGQEFSYEVTSEKYDKLMDRLDEKGIDHFTKYMLITHRFDTNNLWCSILEKEAISYKPSIIDFVGSSIDTNKYFTYGKLNSIDMIISLNSTSLFYWFRNEKRVDEFRSSLKLVVNWIFENLEYNTEFDGLDNDIDALVEILYDNNRERKEIFYHMKTMFVISFLEKFLRLLYLCIDEDAFFDKNKITLGTILGTSENSLGVLDVMIGEHHRRWTRYYFLNEDKFVGLNYRNRLAHLIDINVGEITLPVFMKIVWVAISTINSILVNLVNNKEE